MGQCFGSSKRVSGHKSNIPPLMPGRPSRVKPVEIKKKLSKDYLVQLARHWKNSLKTDETTTMSLVTKEPRKMFGALTHVTGLWKKKKVTADDVLIFEGATFTLAECHFQISKMAGNVPYRFFCSILISAAAFSLSHFLLDIIPEKKRREIYEFLEEPVAIDAVGTQKRPKARIDESRASVLDACNDVNTTMIKGTVYEEEIETDEKRMDGIMPQWFIQRQHILLNQYGYESFPVEKSSGQRAMTRLMNLCVSSRKLGMSLAKEVNSLLSYGGTYDSGLLLRLKQKSIILPYDHDAPSPSTRTVRYQEGQNRSDVSDFVEHIIHFLQLFLCEAAPNQQDLETFNWDHLESAIYAHDFQLQENKDYWTYSRKMKVATSLLNKFPGNSFMQTHFEFPDCIRKWIFEEVSWEYVINESSTDLKFNHSDVIKFESPEGKLLSLLLLIYTKIEG